MTLRQVLVAALAEAELPLPDDQGVADLAVALQSQLRAAGFEIHASDGRCVRPPGNPSELGRAPRGREVAVMAGLCAQDADEAGVYCLEPRGHETPHGYGSIA